MAILFAGIRLMVVMSLMKDFLMTLLLKILILFQHLRLLILLKNLKSRMMVVFRLKMQESIFQTIMVQILASRLKQWKR
ncbi:Ligatin [Zea mays]|uniref:Ligatin n=1 Tax=Zea mays TaxID=4577 RepID=A0A1D6HAN9_MAIZE|nr:Ligatin [Zea mays]